jgi:hypothetical protein
MEKVDKRNIKESLFIDQNMNEEAIYCESYEADAQRVIEDLRNI